VLGRRHFELSFAGSVYGSGSLFLTVHGADIFFPLAVSVVNDYFSKFQICAMHCRQVFTAGQELAFILESPSAKAGVFVSGENGF
jgi:hypothetical protein